MGPKMSRPLDFALRMYCDERPPMRGARLDTAAAVGDTETTGDASLSAGCLALRLRTFLRDRCVDTTDLEETTLRAPESRLRDVSARSGRAAETIAGGFANRGCALAPGTAV